MEYLVQLLNLRSRCWVDSTRLVAGSGRWMPSLSQTLCTRTVWSVVEITNKPLCPWIRDLLTFVWDLEWFSSELCMKLYFATRSWCCVVRAVQRCRALPEEIFQTSSGSKWMTSTITSQNRLAITNSQLWSERRWEITLILEFKINSDSLQHSRIKHKIF